MNENANLFELRQMVLNIVGGKSIVAYAEAWAKERAATWPWGTYSPNDLTTMYECGFYRGYLKGAADMTDKLEAFND